MSEVMSPEEIKGLIKYKYNGGDTSLIYKYFLSPFAQSLVDNFVPTWMAPNMITFLGLIFSLASFFLTLFFNYGLGMNGPRWLPLVVAINLFIYQTLDNMDGKQARKTGTSSPLGMLFDHGIDAINSVLLILPVGSALGTGMSRDLLIIASVGFIPFITQGWEEYYREEMVLPIINGPTEGLLITMGMLVASSFYGAESFHVIHPVPAEALTVLPFLPQTFTFFEICKLNFYFALICTATSQLFVGSKIAFEKGGLCGLARAYLNITPFVIFYFSSLIWCLLSPVALQKYTVLTILLLGSIFVELATHTMLMHICNSSIKPSKRHTIWIPLLLAANLVFSSAEEGVGIIGEEFLIFPLTVFSVYYTAERFYSVSIASLSLSLSLAAIPLPPPPPPPSLPFPLTPFSAYPMC